MRRALCVVALCTGCANPGFDDPPAVIHARFDPDNKSIPMPNDAVRDAAAGRLDLPNDTPAELARLDESEQEFYRYLETHSDDIANGDLTVLTVCIPRGVMGDVHELE